MKIKKKYKLIAALLILLVLVLSAFDVRLKIVRYKIESNKIDSPVRIGLVTDLHSCKYGENQKTLIDAVNKEKPDIILLGGDIFDDIIPDTNTKIFLKAVAPKYPCYYVTGNHEYWSRHSDEMIAWLRANNIYVLDGESVNVEIGNQKISLSGINDPDKERFTGKSGDFDSELDKIQRKKDDNLFRILLAHRPSYIESYLKYDFDLVLCGHAHGGQWRLPPFLNGVYAPDEGWLPKYAGGKYDFPNGQMIVSRGLARESTRVPRIFNRPELVIVDVVRQ